MEEKPAQRTNVLKTLFLVLGFWALALLALGWVRAWPDTIDDAHISFRYVENFVAGNGLSFNPGQIVEGYSNPLVVFFLIPFAAIGFPVEVVMLLVGVVSFFFCAAAAMKLAQRYGCPEWVQLLAAIAVLGHFPLLYYSVTGLETGLYAALIVGGLWRYESKGASVDWAGALLWSAVVICRPEGVLYPAALGVYELIRALQKRGSWKSVGWLLGVGGVFVLFELWRRWYFGMWVPNTFIAKSPGTADLTPGVSWFSSASNYLLDFLYQLGILLPLCGAATCFDKRLRSRLGALWVVVAVGVLFAVYAGGDWMPASRYLLSIAVPLIVAGALGVGVLWTYLRQRDLANAAMALVVLVGVLTLAAPSYVLYRFYSQSERYPYHVMNSRTVRDSAIAMREIYGTNHRIVAHRIGALGRYSGMEVIDLFGLVDHEIAEIISKHPEYHPNPKRGDNIPELRELLRERKPDLMLILQIIPDPVPEVERYGYRYEVRNVFQLGEDQWWVLYVRAD
ncbi:hypothetical protein KQI84_11500 [bacterium]|nr:hypothetical protein [bacterium]